MGVTGHNEDSFRQWLEAVSTVASQAKDMHVRITGEADKVLNIYRIKNCLNVR